MRELLATLILISLWLFPATGFGAPVEVSETFREGETGGQTFRVPVDRIFKNPTLASGLSSGADTLNRSIDSLMEGLFYGLLDNELVYDVTDAATFRTQLKRDVHTTSDGSYVVVDRLSIGPEFLTPLTSLQGIPVNFGAEGKINILDIYLRTDGMRLAEDKDLSWWQRGLNNWFGILPLLTNILPPSFNPNELYDPLRQIQTPFVFPFSAESARKMPVSSIRSYSFSGGVNLSWDVLEKANGKIKEALSVSEDLETHLPFSVFKNGEHRINVLRKTDDVVWVSLSDVDRKGAGASVTMGQAALLFAKVTPYWSGMPAPVFPIDVSGIVADADKADLLYSFDLKYPGAQLAYARAVRGDFTLAHKKYLEKMEFKQETGVDFQLNRKEDSIEHESSNSRNLFVFRQTRNQNRAKAEIETVDMDGKFYVLESNLRIEDETWDALVGSEEVNYNDRVEIKVDKNPDESLKEDVAYTFRSGAKEPYNLTMSLTISDRFLDVLEYRNYVELVRFFTNMPLLDVPKIPLRQEERLRDRRKSKALIDPGRDVENIHVTPTYLGTLNITAAVYFSFADLLKIQERSEDQIWRAFAEAYGVDPDEWGTAARRASLKTSARWMAAFLAYPLRLFNVRITGADAVREATFRVAALRKFQNAKTPYKLLQAFDDLLETDHPTQLARALMILAGNNDIGRSVSFSTKPKGSYSGIARQMFEGLNRKVFRYGSTFPSPERYRSSRDKLAAFEPTELREERTRPVIRRLAVTTRSVTTEEGPIETSLLARVSAQKIAPDKSARIFVRLEEGGRVNVGRFVLAETVVTVSPVTTGAPGENPEYEFYLTGPLSSLSGYLYANRIPSSGLFELTVAVSPEGQVWSEERKIFFRLDQGRLQPVQP